MFKTTYLKRQFYIVMGVCITILLISYSYPKVFNLGKYLLFLALFISFVDWLILFFIKDKISLERSVHEKLSMGDIQKIRYTLNNELNFSVDIEIFDEFPYQLQERTFSKATALVPKVEKIYTHHIRPLSRGNYNFGNINAFVSNHYIGMLERKITYNQQADVAVVPSIIQMKKFELQVFSKTASLAGIRRIRQIGENDEFEHIKFYMQGDNIKAINWKATSRKNQLMVNQFQNSRSQMIYSIIDKGRSMKMPFNGLTLLDHSVNAALVISNIILRKHDRAGLITFSEKIGSIVKAEANQSQLAKISSALYKQQTGFLESNFELMFYTLRRHLSRRSILFFYTNFETPLDLERNLAFLKSLNKKHLLVVISFVNTELIESSEMLCRSKSDIYFKTFAQKALVDKEKIMDQLTIHGIQSILTRPEDLNINVINKYLEIKAKRMQ